MPRLASVHLQALFISLSVLICAVAGTSLFGIVKSDSPPRWFNDDTMRIDLYHVGSSNEERFAIARIRDENAWPGNYANLIDRSQFGDYLLNVFDRRTHDLIFSQSFDSAIETSDKWDGDTETMRMPFPRGAVDVAIMRRDKRGKFVPAWSESIDPSSSSVDHAPSSRRVKTRTIFENGTPQNKVDLVIVGDGYKESEVDKFWTDAARASDYIFSTSPFKEYSSAFNVRSAFLASEESGISSPLDRVWRRSAFGATYNAHGVERSIGVQDSELLHDVAATVPYDAILVITNSKRYGGSAAYRRFAVAAIDSAWSRYLVVHEFGHAFAGLADEYYTLAECKKARHPEPWKPNITASARKKTLKWRSLVAPDTPIPTPWLKGAYERFDGEFARTYLSLRQVRAGEDEVNKLISDALAGATAMLSSEKYYGRVGAFEGAGNEACGLFRPELNCIMFTLTPDRFCAVCSQAIREAVHWYTDH